MHLKDAPSPSPSINKSDTHKTPREYSHVVAQSRYPTFKYLNVQTSKLPQHAKIFFDFRFLLLNVFELENIQFVTLCERGLSN